MQRDKAGTVVNLHSECRRLVSWKVEGVDEFELCKQDDCLSQVRSRVCRCRSGCEMQILNDRISIAMECGGWRGVATLPCIPGNRHRALPVPGPASSPAPPGAYTNSSMQSIVAICWTCCVQLGGQLLCFRFSLSFYRLRETLVSYPESTSRMAWWLRIKGLTTTLR